MATFAFAVIAALVVVGGVLFVLIRLEIRHASQSTRDALADMMRRAHDGYSDPSAAAVAVSPSPAPMSSGEPAPAHAQEAPSTVPNKSRARTTVPVSEPREAIRARLEAEADARERERANKATVEDAAGERRALLPGAQVDDGDRETDEELTHVFTAKPSEADAQIPGVPVKRRPTLLGGLAGAPVDRPVSSAKRAAEAHARKLATTTLVSAGVVAPTPRSGTPVPPSAFEAVDERYKALCDDARSKGLAADHCCGGECYGTPEGVLCTCTCDGCVRATSYAMQAEREIMGPSEDDPDPRKRKG